MTETNASVDSLPGVDLSLPCGQRVVGAITAPQAAERLNTFQVVEFRVVKTTDTGRVTFLNSHDPYQGHFYVAIFPDEYGEFPAAPVQHFDGACVAVQGRVELYKGTPQIVPRTAEDIRIVGD